MNKDVYHLNAFYHSYFRQTRQGYQTGIKAFCSHARGLSTGSKGESYNGLCHSGQFLQYKAGYDAGIKRFCSAERGLSEGREGADSAALCPNELFPEYQNAFYLGLKQFCTFDTGFQLALSGQASNQNCHISEYAQYAEGYVKGKRRLEDIKQIEVLNDALVVLDKKIIRAEKQISQAELIIYSETSTTEGRKLALQEIKQHQQDISGFKFEYQQIEAEIAYLTSLLAQDNVSSAVSQ